MSTPTLADLYPTATKTEIFDFMIDLAKQLGLVTTSWEEGDVTLTEFDTIAEQLASKDRIIQKYVASGFLDLVAQLARDGVAGAYDWLVLLAEQAYGYTARGATFATTFVTFSNAQGGLYQDLAAGDVSLRSSTTGKTYQITNETPFTIGSGPGFTIAGIPVAADEPGSDSTAAAGEIDEIVTGLLGVTVTNPAAAIGTDAEPVDSIVRGCRAKLGRIAPRSATPSDAYDSIALDFELTGTTATNRSRTYGDSSTGDVVQYIAGPSGAVSNEVVAAVELAMVTYAVPLALATYTLASAANLVQPITYQLYLYDSVGLTESEVKQLVETALLEHFRNRPIGGDRIATDTTGRIYRSSIVGAIKAAFNEQDFVKVDLLVPAADTAVAVNQVPVMGLVTPQLISFEEPA